MERWQHASMCGDWGVDDRTALDEIRVLLRRLNTFAFQPSGAEKGGEWGEFVGEGMMMTE